MWKKWFRFAIYELRGNVIYYRYMACKIKKQFRNNSKLSNPQPGIIYMADGKCNPGGLCDRLYGILSLYKLSKEMRMPFYINFTHPFKLSDYLLPNCTDWLIQNDGIVSNYRDMNLIYVFCAAKEYGYNLDKESAIQKNYLLNRMANRSKQYQIYSNAHFVKESKEASNLFNELFVPAPLLKDAISYNTDKINGRYIAVVLRFQNLLGDFKEQNIIPLLESQQIDLIKKLQDKILEIHLSNPDTKVLVTSDSRKFLDSLSIFNFVYTIPGKVVHMSFTDDKTLNTHLKSFVDLFMISHAEHIYLLVTGSMYRSGFAKFASLIHDKPYSEISF